MSLIITNREFDVIFNNILEECVFTTARSGGSGGQHVNKVETKVTLRWDIGKTQAIDQDFQSRLKDKLSKKLNKDLVFVLYHQTERSQVKNKINVIKKFRILLREAFKEPKKRKPTKMSKNTKVKRKQAKQKRSSIKSSRKKPRRDD